MLAWEASATKEAQRKIAICRELCSDGLREEREENFAIL
jgi:hypothetical protein